MNNKMIPQPAAHSIFRDVWASYVAYAEDPNPEESVLHFCLDCEYALRTLYPQMSAFAVVHETLAGLPARDLPATRAALGDHALRAGLWPVRSYFTP